MLIHTGDVDLYYEKTGSGRPLLLVHGNGGTHKTFDEAVTVLSESFTCSSIDCRGRGGSTRVKEYHYRDMADDLVCFINRLGLSDVVFCGFSDGGILGLMAAADCHDISDLIVCGANVSPKGLKQKTLWKYRIAGFTSPGSLIGMVSREPDITKEELGRIRARTLVLTGEHDIVKLSHSEYIASSIKGAKLMVLPGEGHGSYVRHKRRIAYLIKDFVL